MLQFLSPLIKQHAESNELFFSKNENNVLTEKKKEMQEALFNNKLSLA